MDKHCRRIPSSAPQPPPPPQTQPHSVAILAQGSNRLLRYVLVTFYDSLSGRHGWCTRRWCRDEAAGATAALVGQTRAADRRNGPGRTVVPLSSKETEDCQGRSAARRETEARVVRCPTGTEASVSRRRWPRRSWLVRRLRCWTLPPSPSSHGLSWRRRRRPRWRKWSG